MSKVSIIVLNWNNWMDTIECLESLFRIDYASYDVIVVDNGSTNESVKKIREYCEGKIAVNSKFFKYEPNSKPIEVIEYTKEEAEKVKEVPLSSNRRLILIKNDKNYGFAGGNNVGIRFALRTLRPDYILLLNNDTVVDRDFLKELVKVMESDKEIGIAGPKIYYYEYKGRSDVISFTGEDIIPEKGLGKRYGCGEIDCGQWDKQMEVDRLEGSCMLIRREVFEKIGLLDEEYFLYWEETDFCIRTKKAGFKNVYCPKARIWHKIGGSWQDEAPIYYFTRNTFLFIAKNFPEKYRNFLLYFTLYRFWRTAAYYIIRRKSFRALMIFLKGTIDGYRISRKYRRVKNV